MRLSVGMVVLFGCGRIGFDSAAFTGDARSGDAGLPVANVAFVTSTSHVPGELGGLAGADAICAARASEGGLHGTFVAYLSVTDVNAPDRLAGARGWVRPDGRPVAETRDSIGGGDFYYPPRIDERGNDVVIDPVFAATGTYDGGISSNCDDFTSIAPTTMAGYPFFTGGAWSHYNDPSCDTPMRLYCFGIDLDVSLTITPASGRRAFLSSGAFAPSTGISAADAICASEAAGAGFTGSFRALLPDGDVAAARFDLGGPPWLRVDGIELAPTALSFLSGTGRAALDHMASNQVDAGTYVLTGFGANESGAFTPPDADRTCDGWSNANGSTNYGRAGGTAHAGFVETTAGCQAALPVYCLEE